MIAWEPSSLLALARQGLDAAPAEALSAAADLASRPEIVARRLTFLTWAYSVVWLILGAYIITLSVRQRRLARQIRRLRERLGLTPSP